MNCYFLLLLKLAMKYPIMWNLLLAEQHYSIMDFAALTIFTSFFHSPYRFGLKGQKCNVHLKANILVHLDKTFLPLRNVGSIIFRLQHSDYK